MYRDIYSCIYRIIIMRMSCDAACARCMRGMQPRRLLGREAREELVQQRALRLRRVLEPRLVEGAEQLEVAQHLQEI